MSKIIDKTFFKFFLFDKVKLISILLITLLLPITQMIGIMYWGETSPAIVSALFSAPLIVVMVSIPDAILKLRSSSFIKRIGVSRISLLQFYGTVITTSIIFYIFSFLVSMFVVWIFPMFFNGTFDILVLFFNSLSNVFIFIVDFIMLMIMAIFIGLFLAFIFNSTGILVGAATLLFLIGLLFSGAYFDWKVLPVFEDGNWLAWLTPWSITLFSIVENSIGDVNFVASIVSTVAAISLSSLLAYYLYKKTGFQGIRR